MTDQVEKQKTGHLTNPTNCDNVITRQMTKTQDAFLTYGEKFGWGKVEVTFVNGQPVTSKEIERTHRHDI